MLLDMIKRFRNIDFEWKDLEFFIFHKVERFAGHLNGIMHFFNIYESKLFTWHVPREKGCNCVGNNILDDFEDLFTERHNSIGKFLKDLTRGSILFKMKQIYRKIS